MDWIDRYGRNAVWMAGAQIGVLLLLIVYGLLPPSLGSRMVFPGAAMIGCFGLLVFMTLYRPWDWSWSSGGNGWFQRRFPFSDGLLLIGITLAMASGFRSAIGDAKERMTAAGRVDPLRALPDADAEAWSADLFGAMVINSPSMAIAIGFAVAMLIAAWVSLPR